MLEQKIIFFVNETLCACHNFRQYFHFIFHSFHCKFFIYKISTHRGIILKLQDCINISNQSSINRFYGVCLWEINFTGFKQLNNRKKFKPGSLNHFFTSCEQVFFTLSAPISWLWVLTCLTE